MTTTRKRRWPWVLGAVLLVLIGAGAIAVSRIDAFLNDQAAAQAVKLSQRIGRPLRIGNVSLKLLTGLAVQVSDVHVDPLSDEGADAPPLHLDRVEVRVGLLRALMTLGKEVTVTKAEISGLAVNVVKLKNDTTNLERIQAKLTETAPPEEKAKAAKVEEPTDLSFVRINRAELNDGRVRLIDRSQRNQTGLRELSIADIDLSIDDLRAGQPLEVILKAAILAKAQNFELRLKAAPLPKTLIPTPEQVVLKLQPVDLKPLSPFIPKAVGLQAGTVRADLDAHLGAAVPDGEGPTSLKGNLKALQLVFAGAEGGKALDVSLDTDVKANVVKGDLELNTLNLAVGPAKLLGKGKAAGLLGKSPKVEGLEVRGEELDLSKIAAYYPQLTKMMGGVQAVGPIGLLLSAAGDAGAAALKLDLDFTPVRLVVPDQLTKAASAPMRLSVKAKGSGDEALAFEGLFDLSGVDLRPGLVVNKAPGQKTDLAFAGTYKADPTRLELSLLTAHLLQDTLEGKLSAQLKDKTTEFDLSLKSARIDADALLLKSDAPPPPVPPEDPHRFDGYRGKIKASVATVRMSGSDLTQLNAQLTMVDDLLTVDAFSCKAYSGTVVADGSNIRLGPVERPFVGKLQLRGIDMGAAAGTVSTKKIVGGTFEGDVDLKGTGVELASLNKTLEGRIEGKMLDPVLLGTDLLAEVTGPLAKALPFGGSAVKSSVNSTALGKELPFGVTIANGVAQLKKPITVTRPDMGMELDGGMQLTGALNLGGTLSLPPQTIRAVTQGKATPKAPIPVAMKITGPIWKPVVSSLDLKPAVKAIAAQALGGVAERVLGDKAKVITDNAAAAKDNAQQVAQQRANEEREKAEAEARQKLEAEKKRTAEKAKKGLKGVFGR